MSNNLTSLIPNSILSSDQSDGKVSGNFKIVLQKSCVVSPKKQSSFRVNISPLQSLNFGSSFILKNTIDDIINDSSEGDSITEEGESVE